MKITENRNWKTLVYDAIHWIPSLAFLLLFLMEFFTQLLLRAPRIQAALLGQEIGDAINALTPSVPPILVIFGYLFLFLLFLGVGILGSIISMVVDMLNVNAMVESAHRTAWLLLLFAFQPAASLAFWYQHRQRVHATLT